MILNQLCCGNNFSEDYNTNDITIYTDVSSFQVVFEVKHLWAFFDKLNRRLYGLI